MTTTGSDDSDISSSSSSSGSSSDHERGPHRKSQRLDKQQYVQGYEKLIQEVRNSRARAKKGEASNLTISHLNELEALFQNIQRENVRDTKVHLKDSEAFKETADFAAFNARNLKFDDVGLSLTESEFLSSVKRFAGSRSTVKNEDGELLVNEDNYDEEEVEEDEDEGGVIAWEETFNSFNWLRLGALYYQISKRSIKNDFLNGPLATERRRPQNRVRNIDDTKSSISTRAKIVQASDIATNEEQNTAYMIRSIYETFLSKNVEGDVNFFELIINPYSFAQSVENLFFTSFLIKDARLKLYTNGEGIPMVRRVLPTEGESAIRDAKENSSKHNIATLNYTTWQNLIERFNITEAFLGNRDEPEDTIPEEDIDN
ncbi:Nse4 C-terminal-domain-containing protein [Scheffersomyces amazonensis]|uniref:Nse4 C-terminal-domain-containing protein n=1 Tax=Scheffersomyces amazonensis TaxID=1078765 RepID=UPI00315C7CEA